jgi:membrane protease YdiL (CAAX protease family)
MNNEIKNAIIRVAPFLIVILALRIAVARKRVTTDDLAFQAPISYTKLFTWWALFLLYMLITELTLYKNGILEVNPWHHNLLSSIIRISGMVVLAPVAEELLFRGVFISRLLKWKLNLHAAIFIQAFVFVLVHSFTYENTLSSNIGIAQTFIDAALFGYARFNTKSIFTPMLMHATGNLIAVIEQFIF